MSHMSVVSDYIVVWNEKYMEQNLRAISSYPFDDPYPFTNIFWGGTPANDFSIDPDWLQYCERNQQVYDKVRRVWQPYRWADFVERLPQNSE